MTGTDLIRCPKCSGQFAVGNERWTCKSCGHGVPALLGIPNFMPDAPAPSAEALRLAAAYADNDFKSLHAMLEPESFVDDPRLKQHYTNYDGTMMQRGRDFYDMVCERLEEIYNEQRRTRRRVGLVMGCGVGACLLPLIRDVEIAVGVDPELKRLILAKRAAEDIGAKNVVLFQGIAQALPMHDGCVDFTIAEDVIEHLIDIDTAFAEMGRVTREGGVFAGNSVNRYNLLRPEPHVKLWFMGLLPRPMQKRYARWRRGVSGYDDSIRPPSYYALMRAIRGGFGRAGDIVFPKAVAFGFPKAIDRVLSVIERIKPLAVLVLWIFPSHLAIGKRITKPAPVA